MKNYLYILVLALFILSSCSSSYYVSGEYDDLYYTPSDRQLVLQANDVPENNYASIYEIEDQYSLDTLVADDFVEGGDYIDDLSLYDGNANDAFDYYDGTSYAYNLNRFYGNYFDPYWRDPFYYGFGYSAFRYSFGYPNYYYSPYYSYWDYYNPWNPWYGGYGG